MTLKFLAPTDYSDNCCAVMLGAINATREWWNKFMSSAVLYSQFFGRGTGDTRGGEWVNPFICHSRGFVHSKIYYTVTLCPKKSVPCTIYFTQMEVFALFAWTRLQIKPHFSHSWMKNGLAMCMASMVLIIHFTNFSYMQFLHIYAKITSIRLKTNYLTLNAPK